MGFMVNVKSKWKSSYVALIKKVFFIVKQHFWGYYCKQDIFLNEKCFFFIIDIWGGELRIYFLFKTLILYLPKRNSK